MPVIDIGQERDERAMNARLTGRLELDGDRAVGLLPQDAGQLQQGPKDRQPITRVLTMLEEAPREQPFGVVGRQLDPGDEVVAVALA